ncbi:hypothetical protein B0H21DRAFT_736614 [Amylocystis lapponica]|nr:hypothetical protein B0H21DRAFT_736614 [Amylocystis lapponica]
MNATCNACPKGDKQVSKLVPPLIPPCHVADHCQRPSLFSNRPRCRSYKGLRWPIILPTNSRPRLHCQCTLIPPSILPLASIVCPELNRLRARLILCNMFQVASRQAPEALSLPMSHYQPVQVPPSLQLPRNLARPAFSEVSRDVIAALEPELADVPLEYIRKHLAGQANQMLTALSLLTLPGSLPRARLPPSIDAPLRPASNTPSSSAFPTHLLAISSSKSPSAPNTPTAASFASQSSSTLSVTIPLYPTHALVLAAHCTLLPPLPRSRPSNHTTAVSLPIVPLTVPSAEVFPLLHAYLHTRRPDTLLASLLPSLASVLPPANVAAGSSAPGKAMYIAQFSSESLLRLAHGLASSAHAHAGAQGALAGLMAHTKAINGLWRNACALGVFDAELWGVMDLAWEIVLTALTRVAERA